MPGLFWIKACSCGKTCHNGVWKKEEIPFYVVLLNALDMGKNTIQIISELCDECSKRAQELKIVISEELKPPTHSLDCVSASAETHPI